MVGWDDYQGVDDAMGVVIRRIDAPLRTSVRMGNVFDTIGHLIPHVGIR